MNDLMSGGVHRLWKAELIDRLAPRPGQILLDVAGGTGDIAQRFVAAAPAQPRDRLRHQRSHAETGRDRAIDRGCSPASNWLVGDAERLPVASRAPTPTPSPSACATSPHIDAALAEARRVLKPGGRFLCLEFSHVALPLLRQAYDLYSFAVLPLLGQIVAGDRDAYQYLVESIRRFPPQDELAAR